MKRNLGHLLLAIYLLVIGVISLFGINLGQLSFLPGGLALAAGILLLMGK